MGFQKTGHAPRVGEALTFEQVVDPSKPNANGDAFQPPAEAPKLDDVKHEDHPRKL